MVACLGLLIVSLLLNTLLGNIPDTFSRSVSSMAFALVSALARIVAMASLIICVVCDRISSTVLFISSRTFRSLFVKVSRVCFEANSRRALSTAYSTISVTPCADRDIIEISSIRRFFGLTGLE
jgi:hypothetical protein